MAPGESLRKGPKKFVLVNLSDFHLAGHSDPCFHGSSEAGHVPRKIAPGGNELKSTSREMIIKTLVLSIKSMEMFLEMETWKQALLKKKIK